VKDYCNNYDLTSLNIKAGDVITVMTLWDRNKSTSLSSTP
jgi:hypothetical protein